jgi:CheY-like chemotaxis protein
VETCAPVASMEREVGRFQRGLCPIRRRSVARCLPQETTEREVIGADRDASTKNCSRDDDTGFLELMQQVLADEGYETMIHTVGATAHEFVRTDLSDLVILYVRMDDPQAGWQVLDLMRLDRETVGIPVILCTVDSVQLAAKADHLRKHNAVPLEKPFDLFELSEHVRSLVGAPEAD